MRNFFRRLWQIITFPFVRVYRSVSYPFRALSRFLNREPASTAITDVIGNLVTEAETREAFWEHVEDLRAHLVRAIAVLAAAVIAAFWFAEQMMQFLASPVGGLENLQAIQVTEEIGVFMRVAMTAGLAVSFPYIAFELWLFAEPGLTPRERKFGLAGIPTATILFLIGMAFTYYVLLPAALPFLGGFTEIAQFWTAREYFGFVTSLMLWIGLFFEFPLVIYVLSAMGLVQPKLLLQQWRTAIVVIAIIAAAVTPTIDPVNMALVMAPMILLYFISIGLSFLAYAGRRKAESAADEGLVV